MIKTRSPIPSSNSDRPLTTHKPDRLFPQIKQRSPLHPTKPDRLNFNIKQRSHALIMLGSNKAINAKIYENSE
jgi:hypothetical protein